MVKDFPAPNDANFAGPEIKAEVKLWADGVKPNADPKADPKAEPKVKGSPTVLQFGKKDAAGRVRPPHAAEPREDRLRAARRR